MGFGGGQNEGLGGRTWTLPCRAKGQQGLQAPPTPENVLSPPLFRLSHPLGNSRDKGILTALYLVKVHSHRETTLLNLTLEMWQSTPPF